MKTILLKFQGPLQSYGTSSHFNTRQTDFYPSKSAVVGFLAASLGYMRDEDEKIQRLKNLDFAVRVDQEGTLLRDFHMVRDRNRKDQKGNNVAYVTNRYYLEDAIFIVGISSEDESLMEEISEALRYPYFQTFLGRRSLPPTADYYLGNSEENVIDALKNLEWQARDYYKKRNSNRLSIYGDKHLLSTNFRQLRKDNVESFSMKNRRFSYRYEGKIEIEVKDRRENG